MIDKNVRYTENHEWVRDEGDLFVVGITQYAADQLGDITFVELPEVGDEFAQDEEAATVESVKAASDVYSPISGRVAETNSVLDAKPEIINKSPYDEGWFFKMEAADPSEMDDLMDSKEYEAFLKEL